MKAIKEKTRKVKRQVTTVNDLFTRDDVNGLLERLDKAKPHITDALMIYIDNRDNLLHWSTTENTLESQALWMIEVAKRALLEE
jgi:hypothetical protein